MLTQFRTPVKAGPLWLAGLVALLLAVTVTPSVADIDLRSDPEAAKDLELIAGCIDIATG